MVTRRHALSIIGSAAATGWLAACGGQTASKPSPTAAPTASPTPTPVRVAMFSSPVDHIGPVGRQTDSSQPAPWLLGAHQTPSAAYFSFGHAKDENNNWELQWKALALGMSAFGAAANVDGAAPPYGGAHLLTTEAAPQKNPSNLPNHASTALDLLTPLSAAGQPLFAPVWQYVCFA